MDHTRPIWWLTGGVLAVLGCAALLLAFLAAPSASVSPSGQGGATAMPPDTPIQETPVQSQTLEWPRPRFDERRAERLRMVRRDIASQGVRDEAVLDAMRHVPRHLFVPERRRRRAYGDFPLPIGHGQTISQPYIVAYMTEVLELAPGEKALEIGTGSGYQAAVLSELTPRVCTIEIIEELADEARKRLEDLGYGTVRVRQGDGYHGWPEDAPFEAIIVTAAAGHVPPPLIKQLAPGGRMVIPVGGVFEVQRLVLVTKDSEGNVRSKSLLPVRFVPMTGRVQEKG
ncbi:MAG: protein-L-isoaspartate(D-aspartate) O-methyltransferase [Candidatus Brocadiaceae bacterium]|jgi:protein-L-isoaspartate(D-aspartate) O-methyltransferase